MEMDGNDDEKSGSTFWLSLLVAALLALLNTVFYRQSLRYLFPDDVAAENYQRRGRYAVFFGINTFVYILVIQIFATTVSLPILPSATLSGICGYVIAGLLLPDTHDDEGREQQEGVQDGQKVMRDPTQADGKIGKDNAAGEENTAPQKSQDKVHELKRNKFEKLLRQLGLNESSELGLLDQRTIEEDVNSMGEAKRCIMADFFLQLSVGMPHAVHNLSKNSTRQTEGSKRISLETSQDPEQEQSVEAGYGHTGELSCRDILFGISLCCDPFSLQELLRKLVIYGNAVPVILPKLRDDPIFLLWGLRKCSIFRMDPTSLSSDPTNVTTTPFVTVSALRSGESSVSKSMVFNNVLNNLNCSENRQFFIAENKPCMWSLGAVEAAWYVPSNNIVTPEVPVAFFNLRGDSLEFQRQAKFCIKASQILIVFTESFQVGDAETMFSHKPPDTHVILVCPSSEMEHPFGNLGSVTIIETTKRSAEQITQSILEIISGKTFLKTEGESLETISALCKDLGILIDESISECSDGKTTAAGIVEALRGESKEDLFPLQNMWKQWVAAHNETLGERNIEHELSIILEKKREIRFSQRNSVVSTSINSFVESFGTNSRRTRYTYSWLDILLLQSVDIRDLPKEPQVFDRKTHVYSNVEHIYITDFQKELGQMVECGHPCLEQNRVQGDKPILEYFMAMQHNGVPLVLFDSDACAVPLEWLENAFKILDKTSERAQRVCVVSVLGRPKSFKTTLLNRLFGVNFSTQAQVSTEGMLLQLVPVKHPANNQIGCDYLMVIDTHSFDHANNQSPEDMERHECITTLTLCVSDLVIVSTRQLQNETEEKFKILDPSFLRGLIRMRSVNKSARCCLVQHYDANLTQTADYATLSEKLFEEVKRVMSEVVQIEQVGDVGEDLLDVFRLDAEERAIFIPYTASDLQVGPSEQNCQQVIALRELTLQFLKKCKRPQMSFSDSYRRLADVTEALKRKGFVEDFHDTNLQNLKDQFVIWYRDLLLKLTSDLTSRIAASCNELSKVPIGNAGEERNTATNDLTRVVEDGFENVKVQVQERLKSKEYECLPDQEGFFQRDMSSAKDFFLSEIEQSIEKALMQAENTGQLDRDVQDESSVFLATLSQAPRFGSLNSIDSVQEEFHREQSEFWGKLQLKYPLYEMSEIRQNTEDFLLFLLGQCSKEVEATLTSNSLTDYVDEHEEMSTMDDVGRMNDGFNVSHSAAEHAFQEIRGRLLVLCQSPESFSDGSKELIQLVRSHEADFEPLVEKVTMYLFILAKVVAKMHQSHLEKEAEQLCSSSWEDAERHVKMQDIKREEVSSLGYTIEHAEQLGFPTLDDGISLVLSFLEGVCAHEEIVVLKNVLTSKNVRNCSVLPFDLITMQRLDKAFINMLPSLHAEDARSINATVNEAKLIMFGKAFAKQSFDLLGSFEEMQSLVQETIIDDKEEGARTKAAALVHLAAWSAPVIFVKKLEDLNSGNVANTFHREQGKVCLAVFESRCGHSCDSLVADIVYGEIEESLRGVVEDSTVARLREYFLLKAGVFKLKRTFIGTVLRDLCLKEDYLGLANFLEDYDKFSEKWILNFIANECNRENDSLLGNILREVIDGQMSQLEIVMKETNFRFGEAAEQNLSTWLRIFQNELSDQFETSCRVHKLELLVNSSKIERFDDFSRRLAQHMAEMRQKLEEYMHLPMEGSAGDTKVWLLSLPQDIHLELAAVVRGCIEQCPFCGAACENTLEEHEVHETALHYPGGVNGWRDVVSRDLVTFICTSAVASSRLYKTSQDQYRPYGEYKEDYPEWNIPGKIGEPMEFWQYVFNKCNAQFARHHGCHEGNTPTQWSQITKEGAVRSVEKAYKLKPIVMDQ